MTDETRAELRKGIEHFVRRAKHGDAVDYSPAPSSYPNGTAELVVWQNSDEEPPPLTPFEQMCLSGLLGDPAQLREAVVEYLLDQGHEYATACYERGKREERADCATIVRRQRVVANLVNKRDLFEYLAKAVENTPRPITPPG